MITRSGSKYVVTSHSGKKLSKRLSKAGAQKRLAQVEYFKRRSK